MFSLELKKIDWQFPSLSFIKKIAHNITQSKCNLTGAHDMHIYQ